MPSIRLTSLPRMADFALWATACETALWPAGTFARAYAANRRAGIESIIDADPVAACVREIMAERSSWMGSAADLLRAGADRSSDGISRYGAGWPKNPRRSPAVCAGRRPSCGPPASRWPSVVKAAPEPGSSGCTRRSQTPSAPSAACATTECGEDDRGRVRARR